MYVMRQPALSCLQWPLVLSLGSYFDRAADVFA